MVNLLFDLFYTFFKIGLFTIGGGYAMLPLIKKEVIETHAWLSPEEFMDVLAIAEMTPGPIAVNTATFVGYRLAKLPGALFGTLGVVLPSLIIITVIAAYFVQYNISEIPRLKAAFTALRPAVVGLIASAVFSLGKKGILDLRAAFIAGAVFLILTFTNIHPIVILLATGILGGVFFV
ncbi:MAG TPA: chromate transporter [Firmicutes bacterium]|nr:chromate transporter [Bacillota bacterium]